MTNRTMPIPLSQLNTWTNPGALTTSSAAYASIRNALLKQTSPIASRGVEIFLQGSYANSTNIYGDSDVDVVVLYENTFHKDMSRLTAAQQQLHEATFPPATYHWRDLHTEVVAALRSHYGAGAVKPENKSIKVTTGYGTKPSDVIPAVQFRRYATFNHQNDLSAHWGIQFFDSANNPIVNYPKYHITHGEDKNSTTRTNGRYKQIVRLFKNFRNYLVDNNLLTDGAAPSYFIECALHSVPDRLFAGALTDVVPAIIDHLNQVSYPTLLCQNGVEPLIGNGATQWPLVNFVEFVSAAKSGWDNW
jgi:hypothetical protein